MSAACDDSSNWNISHLNSYILELINTIAITIAITNTIIIATVITDTMITNTDAIMIIVVAKAAQENKLRLNEAIALRKGHSQRHASNALVA